MSKVTLGRLRKWSASNIGYGQIKLRKLLRKWSQPKLKIDLLSNENEHRHKFRQRVAEHIRGMTRTDQVETRYT